MQAPTTLESNEGVSNDWDNDWDFDDQVVEHGEEPHQGAEEATKALPHGAGMDSQELETEQKHESNNHNHQGQPELGVANVQEGVLDNALSLEEVVIERPEAIQEKKSQDQPQYEASNEWKGEDLDDIYDDDDDDDEGDDDGSENDVHNAGGDDNGSEEPKLIIEELNRSATPVEDQFQVKEAMHDSIDSPLSGLLDGAVDSAQDQRETATLRESIGIHAAQATQVNDMEHVEEHFQADRVQSIDPESLSEPVESLENEIAGVLDDQSQHKDEPTAEVLDQIVFNEIHFEESHDVESHEFSLPAQESAAEPHAVPIESIVQADPPPTPVEPTESQPVIGPAIDSNDSSEAQALEIRTTGANRDVNILATTSEPSEQMISASILDQFTNQMQRLEEHHSIEIREMQMGHERALMDARNSVSHADCEAQRAEIESNLLGHLREKDEHLQEIMHVNEGMELKMEVLKREVAGTRKLLEEREKEMESSIAAHIKEKVLLAEKLKKMEDNAGSTEADVLHLQAQLKAAHGELEESNEAYAALKARVKAVATELKERRVECRNLAAANVELSDANERITVKLAGLQAQLDDRDRSEVEKGEERDELRGKIKALEEELQDAEKKIHDRDAVGEKALAAYKKKAQNSLAVANARAAAALQAKEEAELEARAARSTADNAVERAQKAEAKGTEALEEARSYVKEMEETVAVLERSANLASTSLSEIQRQLIEAKADEETARAAREKMTIEVVSVSRDLQIEKNKTSELQQECDDLQRRSNDLYDEVETLREELRKNAAAAFMAHNNDGTGSEANGGMDLKSRLVGVSVADKSESESTILMLQRELRDANQAIKELKETLRSTIEGSEENDGVAGSSRRVRANDSTNQGANANDSTPLFYAMEKQAELNQAREEINRLANLLGELQSEKMQAYESMEKMKLDKAAAEARLARYEKLGTSGGSKRSTSTRLTKSAVYGGYGSHPVARKPVDSDAMSVGSVESTDSMDGPTAESSQINLEYLKNVMLSYLNAKTLNERKRLVPAVSAVLCLTPEETAAAMKSVLESGSVESVGLSFFEGLKLM